MKQFMLKIPCNSLNVHDILDCVIHSILFQRLMIPIQPKDEQLQLDESVVYWVKINNSTISSSVKTKIQELVQQGHRQCVVRFYYSISQSWFLSKQQYYESWLLQLHYTDAEYAIEIDEIIQQILNHSLYQIPKLGKDKEIGFDIQFLNNWSQGLFGKLMDVQPTLL
eukprot:NODE_141_length_15967_cov_0.946118.p9 type:complete len:167 gc:universal NODE_141_length_15967_cov_0.946118:9755-10255(+)